MHGKHGVKSGPGGTQKVRVPRARTGMRSVSLARAEFERRYRARFYDMHLVKAGREAELGRYVGYYAPYATSHQDLDRDQAFQAEVRNAALSVVAMVRLLRSGDYRDPAQGLPAAREK